MTVEKRHDEERSDGAAADAVMKSTSSQYVPTPIGKHCRQHWLPVQCGI